MSEKNYSTRDTATLNNACILPVWNAGLNEKTTVQALASFVAGGNLPLTGSITGAVYPTTMVTNPVIMTETGSVPTAMFVQLNSVDTIIEASMTPTVGQLLIVSQKDAGTVGHTLTTAGTFDGTNNTATFDAANETLVLFGVSSTRWIVIQNVGSVALSLV